MFGTEYPQFAVSEIPYRNSQFLKYRTKTRMLRIRPVALTALAPLFRLSEKPTHNSHVFKSLPVFRMYGTAPSLLAFVLQFVLYLACVGRMSWLSHVSKSFKIVYQNSHVRSLLCSRHANYRTVPRMPILRFWACEFRVMPRIFDLVLMLHFYFLPYTRILGH